MGFEKRSENLVMSTVDGRGYKRIKIKNELSKNLILNMISEAHRFPEGIIII